MEQERKEDLSVVYWLKDLFFDNTFINVKDGYPDEDIVLPSVVVDAESLVPVQFQLGDRTRINDRTWYIDIYAKTKTQRDEIGYRILHALEDGIPVYDYDQGFPPDVSPASLGSLEIGDIRMTIIKILPELVSTMYYRATISFAAKNNQI